MNPPDRWPEATLTASGGAVAVSPHYLASEAAIDVIKRGGNAVDAAIATNATLGVVAPETCGIGGDLFAIVHTPGSRAPVALNSSGRAGRGAQAATLRDRGLSHIPITSPFAVTVPGCVDGWIALSKRFGSLPLAAVLGRATELAQTGFRASPELAGSLDRLAADLGPQAASRGLYPSADSPAAGDVVTRPALAETLRAIAHNGRDGFYAGTVGTSILDATDGVLTQADLDSPQAEWIDPVSIDVFGRTGWTIPPNSQGYLTLAAAWLFEQLDPPHDPEDPAFIHAAIEAFRAVAWERDDLVADPAHLPMPASQLLATDRLDSRLSSISPDARTDWPSQSPAGGGTAYMCVRDSSGIGISLIQSNYHGIGSRIGAGDSGFFLHDRGSDFSLIPGHPNELAPGKRPLHTLSPTLWTADGDLDLLLGTRGGDFQPQTLLQMITYMRWGGLDAAAAHLQPRWATDEWRRSGDSDIVVELHTPSEVVADLERRGHVVRRSDRWMSGWGPVSAIVSDGPQAHGAADPRGATTTATAY